MVPVVGAARTCGDNGRLTSEDGLDSWRVLGAVMAAYMRVLERGARSEGLSPAYTHRRLVIVSSNVRLFDLPLLEEELAQSMTDVQPLSLITIERGTTSTSSYRLIGEVLSELFAAFVALRAEGVESSKAVSWDGGCFF